MTSWSVSALEHITPIFIPGAGKQIVLKVLSPSSGVLPVPPKMRIESQRKQVRAEGHRLDFIVCEKTVDAEPDRLVIFLNTLIPSGLSEFQERLEVGLVA